MRRSTIIVTLCAVSAAGALPGAARAQTPAPSLAPPRIAPPTTASAAPRSPSSPAPLIKPTSAAPAPSAKPGASPAAGPSPVASPAASPMGSPAPSPAAPVTVIVQNAPPPTPEPKSDLVAGWIGLGVIAIGGFFGWRAMKARGMTVTGAFKKMGVELPADAPAGSNAGLKPVATPAPLPPLPSLSDLPSAGPASGGVAVASAPTAPPLPAPTGAPRLSAIAGPLAGQNFPLSTGASVLIGRETAGGIAVPGDSTISRRHARVEQLDGGWAIIDESSSNGTFVNGQRISAPQPLAHGDEIKIGSIRLRYEA